MVRTHGTLSGMSLVLLLAACSDYTVKSGVPELEVGAAGIDFGDVVVGMASTATVGLSNVGSAPLMIELVELDGTSSLDFDEVTVTSMEIGKGEEISLSVRYRPDAVGMDFGRIELQTNQEDNPIVSVDISGMGVEPEIDLNPGILWFGEVAPGASETKTVEITARGSGTLKIEDIALDSGLEGVFSWELPGGAGLPYEMASGVSALLSVTFSPMDGEAWTGELTLSSNDPGARKAAITLLGNSGEEPKGSSAPEVSISRPDWGDYFLTTETVDVTGVVYDAEDPATDLVCLAYAGSTPVGTATPSADGAFAITAAGLPAGDQTLSVRCLDTEGMLGQDSVDITVWDPEEPVVYTLSGGDSSFEWFSVDDDVSIYLDGALVYSDTNHTRDTLPPVLLDASLGSEIRVVVTDYNYCDTGLDPLRLHFGTSRSQDGVAGFCRSACPDHACYDAAYAGPWPSVVYEETFVVEIP